ncbi:response regulator [Natrinema altunense]|uniref:Response regulator receiver n=1 Tax=Natrinema altunense (strain JCM 12890 / CGMCC 1.3731 / AJ2) TaxID=1227494 RepID=L9ZEX9_NATA2|nr:response regulator [Natrinema altunense]ELY84591.1 response regulator receiver [Natrinema altunense JCM 12890]
MSTETERTGEQIDILLVEPNPGDSRLFEEQFADAKLLNTIHIVSDGDSALDFVHQRNEYADEPCPDIVLLEPQLPGKSGIDVLSELKNDPVLAEIPVIVLTSSDAGEKIVQSHGLEADTYMQKPVEPEDFVEFVRSIEEFWFAIVQTSSQ